MDEPRTDSRSLMTALWANADAVRRRRGQLMDQLGFGPITTPARVAYHDHMFDLLAYQPPNPTQPVLLIVPAPIKTAYIWDLAPGVSVVQRCRQDGFQVYLIAWRRPQPGDELLGLAQYADQMILDCVEATSRETGQFKVFIAGHSLGATLAAIFGSLHPNRLHGLIAVEGQMHFSRDQGSLESSAAKTPAADVGRLFGNVPGSFLNLASSWADPTTFNAEPLTDWWGCWPSSRARRLYARVRRWTLDETPLPQRLFEEIVDGLYREDRFASGTLLIDGCRADPSALTVPILAVTDARSRIVPRVAIEAYRDRTGSKDVEFVDYPGDAGVMLRHVGALIGDNAHRYVWPRATAWMHERMHAAT